jgi:hypothetical protein
MAITPHRTRWRYHRLAHCRKNDPVLPIFSLLACILTVTLVIEFELSGKGGDMALTVNTNWDLAADVIVIDFGADYLIDAQKSDDRRANQSELKRKSHHVNLP